MSNRWTDRLFRRMACRCLATAGLALGVAAFAGAEQRAGLEPPVAARPYVSRASSEELPPDLAAPAKTLRRSEPVSQFPPTYSSGKTAREFPRATGMWKRLVGVFGGDEASTSPTIVVPAEAPKPVDTKRIVVQHEQTAQSAIPPRTTQLGANAPAWQWYGYGAPLPGGNTLAPTGRYHAVQPAWYTQTGATPGAIPKTGGPMQGPALRVPTESYSPPQVLNQPPVHPIVEPESRQELLIPIDAQNSSNGARQADLLIPDNGPKLDSTKPATLELPVPRTSQHDARVAPTSLRESEPVFRGQGPEVITVPSAVIAALKKACTGHATKIDVTPRGSRQIGLRLSVVPGILPDRLADRITKLPELDGWEIEMHFAR